MYKPVHKQRVTKPMLTHGHSNPGTYVVRIYDPQDLAFRYL